MVQIGRSANLDKLHARMLFARLKWPLPMTRWFCSRDIAALLVSPKTQAVTKEVFLETLLESKLESHVSGLLFIIYTFELSSHFTFDELLLRVNYPSILTEYLLSQMYPADALSEETNWYRNHANQCPEGFEANSYFKRGLNEGVIIPLIFKAELEKFEERTKLPFLKQWEYEWHLEMQSGKHVYSGTPHYFFRGSRQNFVGKFDTHQHDVFLSTHLRTINFAVDNWGMPRREALHYGLLSIQMNPGLAEVEPISPPDIPIELSTGDFNGVRISDLFDRIEIFDKMQGSILSLTLPMFEDGLHSVEASYVLFLTKGNIGDVPEDYLKKAFEGSADLWIGHPPHRFDGVLDPQNIKNYTTCANETTLIPTVLNTFKPYMGRWNQPYFGAEIRLPAGYLFERPLRVESSQNGLTVKNDVDDKVAEWKVWHKDLSPVHPKGGEYSFGMLTMLDDLSPLSQYLKDGFQKNYIVRVRKWTKEREYSTPTFSESFIVDPYFKNASSNKRNGLFSKLKSTLSRFKSRIANSTSENP